jgi:CIC family chloride channel protein
VLVLKRSILTEKVARRAFHVSREYAIDPLEILFARDVMDTEVIVLPEDASLESAASVLSSTPAAQNECLFPAVDAEGGVVGVITRRDLERAVRERPTGDLGRALTGILRRTVVTARSDEPLRAVVHRMAETGRTRIPVVDPANASRLVGLVSLKDLLKARVRHLEEERRRERVLPLSVVLPFARFVTSERR